MTKKRLSFIAIAIIIPLSVFLVYWFFLSNPTAFPEDEQLLERMNPLYSQSSVKTIQDTIRLDEEHVFVPFISVDNEYGTSYWVWENHEWKPSYIETTGEPIVWKLDREDPSSFHIVWNIHPDDLISHADFYLMRERGYHITYGEHTYIPRVQMKKSVDLGGKSYGAMKLPGDWLSFMTQKNELALAQNPQIYTTSLLPDMSVQIGWMPFNENNETVFPKNSVNGNGYINGDIETNFIRLLNKSDLE